MHASPCPAFRHTPLALQITMLCMPTSQDACQAFADPQGLQPDILNGYTPQASLDGQQLRSLATAAAVSMPASCTGAP